jgi:hypothetical protein
MAACPFDLDPLRPKLERSIANGNAEDVGALQCSANRLGLILVEAGKARAEQPAIV